MGSVLLNGITTFAVPIDWLDLKGCYSTVTFNGQPGSSKKQDWGEARLEDNFSWATMPGVEHISSFNFTLFMYRQGNTSYMDFAWIFPEYGTSSVSTDRKTRVWQFDGPMICTGLCSSPTPFTMRTRVEVTDIGDDSYRIHNWRQIPELPDQSMDADDVYVVKRERQNCTMCEKNPDGSFNCAPYP